MRAVRSLALLSMVAAQGCAVPPSGVVAAPGDAGLDAGTAAMPPPPATDAGVLEVQRIRSTFVTTADVMRRIIAPTCAAQNNECHANEHFPDLSSEGNLLNLVGQPCNQEIGERITVEDFCEAQGDQLRIEDGVNAGFVTRVGSIAEISTAEGTFARYEITVDTPPNAQVNARFVIVRDGLAHPALGSGASLQIERGGGLLVVNDARDIPAPLAIRQGDENKNGLYGDGRGVLVRPGDARNSYLIRRLTGLGTSRARMPLNTNSDNPTEINPRLSEEEMYVLMSWINCLRPAGGDPSVIRYDCPANDHNDGRWR